MSDPAKDPLSGSSVLVTGGCSGIGLATARLLAARGARVAVSDISAARVEETVSALADFPHPVLGVAADVRSADDCERLLEFAETQLGPLAALVHCAGVLRPAGVRPRPLYEVDDDEYDFVVGTNLKGAFLINRAALKRMMPRRAGQIVNLSSTSGRRGRPLDSVYSASKAGVIALSESISEEVRGFGIRVQVILPDAVATPLWQQNGALGAPPPGSLPAERVAELVAFCLSLPADACCENLVLAPLRPLRAKRASKESS